MSFQANDIQGRIALKKLARREHAKAVLAKPPVPGAATLFVLAGAVTAAAASILVETSAISKPLAAVVVGVVVGVVMLCIEQWTMRRRLDAVIELLNLDKAEAR